jgi:hypothetical protein
VERLFSYATGVVLLWGAFNTILAVTLAGFTAAGFDHSAGNGGFLQFGIYAISATLVFLLGLAVWAGRRRRATASVPPRPATALLLAVSVALAWLGVGIGGWMLYLAAAALLIACVYEFYPRTRPSE